ncbi:MAG: hypothetical protein QOC70_2791 [Verrucomicrobiota bacterium]|jgi:hypothetical protein
MNTSFLIAPHRCSPCLRAFVRPLHFFFLASTLAAIPAAAIELRRGSVYPLTFTDVDRHQLSTSDGHVTIITVVTRKDEQKAQQVGDRVPHVYLGDPKFRLITLVNFQRSMFPPFQGLTTAIIRSRMDAEAKDLQKVYASKHLTRNPRSDIFVVADFDGKAVSQLGIAPSSSEFAVFVFDTQGRLVRRWNEVPSAEALTGALNEAR